ncbi:response regulator [Desulfobaculum sp. SPO524]|uniref:response regulator n=1 Tax=Desulfobaculum sp. SPO524 TaxID=3378071 RepID=UPI003852BD68
MARILIAEDDYVAQLTVSKMVIKLGHTPFVSPNGRHAYEALKAANNFDLLITDIMMPEMDGQQLIKTLRGDSEFMKLPVIIMSAVVGVKDISSLLELGATFFLAKPMQEEELAHYIDRCLE